jgi:hypothetical protein
MGTDPHTGSHAGTLARCRCEAFSLELGFFDPSLWDTTTGQPRGATEGQPLFSRSGSGVAFEGGYGLLPDMTEGGFSSLALGLPPSA